MRNLKDSRCYPLKKDTTCNYTTLWYYPLMVCPFAFIFRLPDYYRRAYRQNWQALSSSSARVAVPNASEVYNFSNYVFCKAFSIASSVAAISSPVMAKDTKAVSN